MKKLFKEPLLHFFVLGALLFALYSLVNKDTKDDEIIVDNADIEYMTELWRMQWQRAPNLEELKGLINKYINQEVLYREALRMNLDHNDEIVKRRLAQKMEFLSQDLTGLIAPASEENLIEYFNKHKEKYATPYRYTMYQIVFTPDNHEIPLEKAKAVLNNYNSLAPMEMKNHGDNFPLDYALKDVDAFYINREFGEKFSKQLETLETNRWIGPVSSGFGQHLVYIESKTAPRIPEFKNVETVVKRDYEYDMEKEGQEAILRTLKNNYKIRINADNMNTITSSELAQN